MADKDKTVQAPGTLSDDMIRKIAASGKSIPSSKR
jgi:hypothetical protein